MSHIPEAGGQCDATFGTGHQRKLSATAKEIAGKMARTAHDSIVFVPPFAPMRYGTEMIIQKMRAHAKPWEDLIQRTAAALSRTLAPPNARSANGAAQHSMIFKQKTPSSSSSSSSKACVAFFSEPSEQQNVLQHQERVYASKQAVLPQSGMKRRRDSEPARIRSEDRSALLVDIHFDVPVTEQGQISAY